MKKLSSLKFICQECGHFFKSKVSLSHHVKLSHTEITHQEYYEKYLLENESEKICTICGKSTYYQGWNTGFTNTCGNEGCRREQIKQTHLNCVDEEKALEKRKQTNFKLFGVENCFKSDELKLKGKQTCLDNFGVDNPMKSEKVRDKGKQTKKELHNDENYNNRPLAKKTIKKIYNVDNASQSELIKSKKYITMKKNGSTASSKYEKQFSECLIKNNIKFERNYKSINYPFKCDFYISAISLYIELNFHFSHGKEPFNFFKKDHLEVIKEWTKRGNETNLRGERKLQYIGAIKVWTIKDPLKRQTALKNKLNYIEIFDGNKLEELLKFIQKDYENGYYLFV
jgi:hypothetical protein